MLRTTVLFGNHNRYDLEIPGETCVGNLCAAVAVPLHLPPSDVLYVILNGIPLWGSECDYDQAIEELVNGPCMIHLILKSPVYEYPPCVLHPSVRLQSWIKSQGQGQVPTIAEPPAQATNMTDVEVRVSAEAYEAYVEVGVETPLYICTICGVGPGTPPPSGRASPGTGASPGTRNTGASPGTEEPTDAGPISRVRLCGHLFHDNCLRSHLTETGNVRCPYCNQDVRDLQQDDADSDADLY